MTTIKDDGKVKVDNDNKYYNNMIKKLTTTTSSKREKLVKITTIVGPQAEALIEASKRGCSLQFKGDSVKGLTILDVYGEASEYWREGC